MGVKKTLTTDVASLATYNQNSRSATPGGSILVEDHHFD